MDKYFIMPIFNGINLPIDDLYLELIYNKENE